MMSKHFCDELYSASKQSKRPIQYMVKSDIYLNSSFHSLPILCAVNDFHTSKKLLSEKPGSVDENIGGYRSSNHQFRN